MEQGKEPIGFYYYKTLIDKDNKDLKTDIKIDYASLTKFEPKNGITLKNTIEGAITYYFMDGYDYNQNDITDIVKKIRELTKGIREEHLEVLVLKTKSHEFLTEWVEYQRGCVVRAGARKTNPNTTAEVKVTPHGTEVTFEETNRLNKKRPEQISKILKPLYEEVISLCSINNEGIDLSKTPKKRTRKK